MFEDESKRQAWGMVIGLAGVVLFTVIHNWLMAQSQIHGTPVWSMKLSTFEFWKGVARYSRSVSLILCLGSAAQFLFRRAPVASRS